MIINIVAGSPTLDMELLKDVQADLVIGVDRGAYKLIRSNMRCDIAVGDFDSISTDQFLYILNNCPKVHKYESEKAKTDSDIALEYALQYVCKEINLFGVTGKRIDHFLSVMNLFKHLVKRNIRLNIIDNNNKLYVLTPGEYNIKQSIYRYISFFSYNGEVLGLNLKHFKFELSDYTLTNDDSLCVSNEFIDSHGVVKFDKGYLLIVESND